MQLLGIDSPLFTSMPESISQQLQEYIDQKIDEKSPMELPLIPPYTVEKSLNDKINLKKGELLDNYEDIIQ